MKKILLMLLLLVSTMQASAYDFLRAVKDSIPGGYNFWVYTPIDYFYSQEQTPVIIFLHGQAFAVAILSECADMVRSMPLSKVAKLMRLL